MNQLFIEQGASKVAVFVHCSLGEIRYKITNEGDGEKQIFSLKSTINFIFMSVRIEKRMNFETIERIRHCERQS